MISLKKYLDLDIASGGEPRAGANSNDLLSAGLQSYRITLVAAGEAGVRACPAVSSELQMALEKLAKTLERDLDEEILTEAGKQASQEFRNWGDRAVEYLNERTAEIKELLLTLARTATSVGERDKQHSDYFVQFTTRLRSISSLEDLSHIRASLVQQATELKSYVDDMKQESQKVIAKLQSEVNTYEERLKKVERLALYDRLTGLSNRSYVEEDIEGRIRRGQPFCVIMLDLNRLKQVNDTYGHLAGDNFLRQFAQELRSASRSSDGVGRWGGDEFLLVVDGQATGAQVQIERMKTWVFGQYSIRPGKGSEEVKVTADAAIGLAEWQPGETLATLIERADTEMYKQKQQIRAGGLKLA